MILTMKKLKNMKKEKNPCDPPGCDALRRGEWLLFCFVFLIADYADYIDFWDLLGSQGCDSLAF